jgi:hypothetical protein
MANSIRIITVEELKVLGNQSFVMRMIRGVRRSSSSLLRIPAPLSTTQS